MKNPRIAVTLNSSDFEILNHLSDRQNVSISSLAKRMIESCLEEYEDMLLAKRAEKAEKEWIKGGSKTISEEDLCRELGIELSTQNEPEKTLDNSPRISKKGSLGRSTKGSRLVRRKSASR